MKYLTCDGDLRSDSSGNWYNCSSQMIERPENELVVLLEANGVISQSQSEGGSVYIDPAYTGAAFMFTFSIVLAAWAAGFKINIARKGIAQIR